MLVCDDDLFIVKIAALKPMKVIKFQNDILFCNHGFS